MIDLYSGQLAELIGVPYRNDPKVRALSYALQMEKQRIMDEAKTTRTLAMIDQLPEPVLDVLAVELRTPYYDGGMDIDTKRSIIKRTLVWFEKAGTTSAVEEMIEIIFGNGFVEEWFDFIPGEGSMYAGQFDLVADAPMQDPAVFIPQIQRIISRVKNARSHLRRVGFWRKAHTTICPAAMVTEYPVIPISMVISEHHDAAVAPVAVGLSTPFSVIPISMVFSGTRSAEVKPAAAAHPQPYQEVTIGNRIQETKDTAVPASAAVAPEAASEVTIHNVLHKDHSPTAAPTATGMVDGFGQVTIQ